MSTIQSLLNKKSAAEEGSVIATGMQSSVSPLEQDAKGKSINTSDIVSGITAAITVAEIIRSALPAFSYFLKRIKYIIRGDGTVKKADAQGIITAETDEERQILAHLETVNPDYAMRVDEVDVA